MRCPRCAVELQQVEHECKTVAFGCGLCGGTAITMSGLRASGIDAENSFNIWNAALNESCESPALCPECGNPMRTIKLDDGEIKFEIDVCIKCHTIWFDGGELERIPLITPPADPDAELPSKAREILALNEIKKVKPVSDPVVIPHRFGFATFTADTPMGGYGAMICSVLNLVIRLLLRRYIGL